jgi:hypothetical protein
MDSKSIRNHRSVSEDESQIVYGFSPLQSFPEGKRKSYHVQNEECVAGVGGRLDKCLLSQAASMVGLIKRTRISWHQLKRPTILLRSIPKTYSSICNIILLLFHKRPIAYACIEISRPLNLADVTSSFRNVAIFVIV